MIVNQTEARNLIMACAIFDRVRGQLDYSSRVQITSDELSNIGRYIQAAIKKVLNVGDEALAVAVGKLGSAVESINDSDRKFSVLDYKSKDTFLASISEAITEFVLACGKILTESDFEYTDDMFDACKSIVDQCLQCGYCFDM